MSSMDAYDPVGGVDRTVTCDATGPYDAVLRANIVNMPAVVLSGTPAVTLSGTPAVTLSGTPTVTLSGTPNVAVSGPVTVAGTVALSGTSPVSVVGTAQVAGTINTQPVQVNMTVVTGASATTINSGNPVRLYAIRVIGGSLIGSNAIKNGSTTVETLGSLLGIGTERDYFGAYFGASGGLNFTQASTSDQLLVFWSPA